MCSDWQLHCIWVQTYLNISRFNSFNWYRDRSSASFSVVMQTKAVHIIPKNRMNLRAHGEKGKKSFLNRMRMIFLFCAHWAFSAQHVFVVMNTWRSYTQKIYFSSSFLFIKHHISVCAGNKEKGKKIVPAWEIASFPDYRFCVSGTTPISLISAPIVSNRLLSIIFIYLLCLGFAGS